MRTATNKVAGGNSPKRRLRDRFLGIDGPHLKLEGEQLEDEIAVTLYDSC